jgi:hypothetical protein
LTICCSALAQREQLRDDADVSSGTSIATRSTARALAVDLAGQHLRLADGELEAFAAHQLDEHRELQLAAALHLPRVRPLGRVDAQRTLPTSSWSSAASPSTR